MSKQDFESAFSDFLDRPEYDQAESSLFAIVRFAFLSGWQAAGGDPPEAQQVLRIVDKNARPKPRGAKEPEA